MFWKKKSKEEDGKKRLFKMPTETRGAFRVLPAPDAPIVMKVEGKTMNAVDISSGGISFDNNNYKLKASYSIELMLPKDAGPPIVAKAVVLKIDETDVCRCKVEGLNPDQEDRVHHYVLERQKQELAEKKNKYS
ncbi:MAG: PilZ domain-containing protein [Nitrospinae bacterium]|nr:PilZ domain-containing protein [Nitrospinota bacterium]